MQRVAHSDIRSSLVLIDSQSMYNFTSTAKCQLLDSLNQFDTYDQKQLNYINQEFDIYIPPNLYKNLIRKGASGKHNQFK